MSRIEKVNLTFLATVLCYLLGSYLIAFLSTVIPIHVTIRLILSQLILVLPAAFYIRKNHIPIKEAIRLNKMKWTVVILLIVFSACIWPLMSFINAVSMLFAENHIGGTMQEITALSYPLGMLTIAIIPAILEESVYRGIFYNEYRKISIWKGLLISGLLFGLMHMNFNQFLYAFAMGMVFALVIEATDSILSSMLIHFVINGFSTTVTYLLPKLQDLVSEAGMDVAMQEAAQASAAMDLQTVLQVGMAAVGPTILAAVLLWLMAKNSGRWEVFKDMFKRRHQEENLITTPLMIGIALCAVYMFLVEFV